MPSIRIDCLGEVPTLDHRQRHTQALLQVLDTQAPPTAELVRAQARDLLEDAAADGVGQDLLLALCLEAIRQLGAPQEAESWSVETNGLLLSYGQGRKIRPGEPFREIDLYAWIDIIEEEKLDAYAGGAGAGTQTEANTGLPDPERLVIGAALCLLDGYASLSGNNLHATYAIEGIPCWADLDHAQQVQAGRERSLVA